MDVVTYTNCNLIDWKLVGSQGNRDFFVYPNPTSGILTIAYEQKKNEQLVFELVDLNGRLLTDQTLSNNQGMVQIDISDLPDGTFIYSIRNEKKVLESGQVVKQR